MGKQQPTADKVDGLCNTVMFDSDRRPWILFAQEAAYLVVAYSGFPRLGIWATTGHVGKQQDELRRRKYYTNDFGESLVNGVSRKHGQKYYKCKCKVTLVIISYSTMLQSKFSHTQVLVAKDS